MTNPEVNVVSSRVLDELRLALRCAHPATNMQQAVTHTGKALQACMACGATRVLPNGDWQMSVHLRKIQELLVDVGLIPHEGS